MKLCGCGCGETVKPGRRFLHGHNLRLVKRRPLSEEVKKRISIKVSEYLRKHHPRKVERTTVYCLNCDKPFERKVTETKKFCGEKCYWSWLSRHPTGMCKEKIENKLPRETRKCPVCGKEFTVIITSTQKYCSKKCYHRDPRIREIRSKCKIGDKNPTKRVEVKDKIREKRLEQKFPCTDTAPELIMKSILDELGVAYLSHKPIGNICQPDFVLPVLKIAVFVDGDYWHANTRFYTYDELDEVQKANVEKDRRQEKALEKLGWKVLRFWEYDLKFYTEMCKNKLREVIEHEYRKTERLVPNRQNTNVSSILATGYCTVSSRGR